MMTREQLEYMQEELYAAFSIAAMTARTHTYQGRALNNGDGQHGMNAIDKMAQAAHAMLAVEEKLRELSDGNSMRKGIRSAAGEKPSDDYGPYGSGGQSFYDK